MTVPTARCDTNPHGRRAPWERGLDRRQLGGRVIELDTDARVLGFLLGLGDLNHRPCMTYSCGCVCGECSARAAMPAPAQPAPQPWELVA
jgi:hypothetical protein